MIVIAKEEYYEVFWRYFWSFVITARKSEAIITTLPC